MMYVVLLLSTLKPNARTKFISEIRYLPVSDFAAAKIHTLDVLLIVSSVQEPELYECVRLTIKHARHVTKGRKRYGQAVPAQHLDSTWGVTVSSFVSLIITATVARSSFQGGLPFVLNITEESLALFSYTVPSVVQNG
jgi:hypothetical protein